MFEDDSQDHIQVSIFNSIGKLMNKEPVESKAGLNSYNIPLSLAADALYIIQLRNSDNELASVKYVKTK